MTALHSNAPAFALTLALAGSLGLAPATARAQQPNNDARARDEFLAGRDLFARGNYGEAAQHFQRAYDLSHRPQLLYNLGTSFDRLHQWESALHAFEQFQREIPDALEHDEVESRLRVIRDEIAQEQRREQELQRERERATRAAAAAANRPVIVVRDPPRPWLYGGYVVGGLGIVALLAGASVAGFGTASYNQARDDCGVQGNCPASTVSSLYIQAVLSEGLLIGGGVLVVAAGASLYVDSRRPRASAHPSDTHAPVSRWIPTVTVTPGSASLNVVGTF